MTAAQSDRERAFVAYLEGLAARGDRAALAALRRGLSGAPGAEAGMHRYVVAWLPARGTRFREDCFYLVAALFASHPQDWKGEAGEVSNFGASFARLAREAGSASIESRFAGLLNADGDQLAVHLRHAVSLMKSKSVAVDWARLLEDVQKWNWERRTVQREWARAFWTAVGRAREEAEASEEARPVE